MFRCQNCGKNVGPGVRANKVITESKEKIYSNGSQGHEIVQEKKCCNDCSDKLKK
jgi:hypothetical protein